VSFASGILPHAPLRKYILSKGSRVRGPSSTFGERIVGVGVRHSDGNNCVFMGDDDLMGGEVELSNVSGLQTEI
jgi:hypothetical protein